MVTYWLIRTSSTRNRTIEFSSRRRVRIAKGDPIIIYNDSASPSFFEATGIIQSVEKSQEIVGSLSRYIYSYETLKKLEDPLTLDDLKYSLRRVRRFDKPFLHFRGPYSRLDRRDFEAIAGQRVFWARTAVGELANALPISSRRQFLAEYIVEHPELGAAGDLRLLWSSLKRFIDKEQLAVGKLVVAISGEWSALDQALAEGLPGCSFSDEGDRIPDDIAKQSSIFESLFEELNNDREGGSFFDAVDKTIEGEESHEKHFMREFSRIQWPIQID